MDEARDVLVNRSVALTRASKHLNKVSKQENILLTLSYISGEQKSDIFVPEPCKYFGFELFFSVLYRDPEHDGDPAEPVLGIQEREEHFPAIQSAAGHDQGGLWNI